MSTTSFYKERLVGEILYSLYWQNTATLSCSPVGRGLKVVFWQ